MKEKLNPPAMKIITEEYRVVERREEYRGINSKPKYF